MRVLAERVHVCRVEHCGGVTVPYCPTNPQAFHTYTFTAALLHNRLSHAL